MAEIDIFVYVSPVDFFTRSPRRAQNRQYLLFQPLSVALISGGTQQTLGGGLGYGDVGARAAGRLGNAGSFSEALI